MPDPTFANVAYGPHERNVIDLWQPASADPAPLYVYIHGGGFRGGDKRSISPVLLEEFLAAGVAVAATNYRFSEHAAYPAAMLDGKRAIQYLRSRAGEWNLDADRVAAGGGSAGSGIAFWLGFQPDLAEPQSDDPVARQSTALTCIASWQAQCSYAGPFIKSIISGGAWKHEVLLDFFRLTVEEFDSPRGKQIMKEVNFIDYAGPESPPVFLWYTTPDLPMTPDLDLGAGIHHPKFGQVLKEKLDRLGVECVLRQREHVPETPPDEIAPRFARELAAFVIRHLGVGSS